MSRTFLPFYNFFPLMHSESFNKLVMLPIKLTQKAMQQVENMIERVTSIEKWAVDILWY